MSRHADIARSRPTLVWITLLVAVAMLVFGRPVAAQQKFIDRNFTVRIAVAREVQALAVMPTGACAVEDSAGTTVAQLRRAGIYHVEITPGQPGGRSYGSCSANSTPISATAR
jgi:hypothetical protein